MTNILTFPCKSPNQDDVDIDPATVLVLHQLGKLSFYNATRLILGACDDASLVGWMERLILAEEAKKSAKKLKKILSS